MIGKIEITEGLGYQATGIEVESQYHLDTWENSNKDALSVIKEEVSNWLEETGLKNLSWFKVGEGETAADKIKYGIFRCMVSAIKPGSYGDKSKRFDDAELTIEIEGDSKGINAVKKYLKIEDSHKSKS